MSQPSPHETAQVLLEQGKAFYEIELSLLATGISPQEAAACIGQLKKKHYHLQNRRGMALIGAGVVLCIVGFIVVITQQHAGTVFNVALYGMTGVGSTSIMGGLALIMG